MSCRCLATKHRCNARKTTYCKHAPPAVGAILAVRVNCKQIEVGSGIFDDGFTPLRDGHRRFVCGQWSRDHPGLANQFHLVDNQLKVWVLKRLPAFKLSSDDNLSVMERIVQGLHLCLSLHEYGHDHRHVVEKLLGSVGIDWPRLEALSRERSPFFFLKVFLNMSLGLGLPVFFQVSLRPLTIVITGNWRRKHERLMSVSMNRVHVSFTGCLSERGAECF